jgi:hypothetical protein
VREATRLRQLAEDAPGGSGQPRRMRDSNRRGLAPNPLSKSELAGSRALADVLQAWLEEG